MKLRITVESKVYEVDVEVLDNGGHAAAPSPIPAPRAASGGSAAAPAPAAPSPAATPSAGGDKDVKSPLAGTVLSVAVKPGDKVALNQPLLVLEAMKMESNVASPVAGEVAEVLVQQGNTVAAGQVLVRFA